jgi:deoxyribodipyrimidine photo-lyase
MTRSYQLALHVFRRDLRLQDNTALIKALQQSDQVIPCFIFDERQIKSNPYKSEAAIQFMVQSLHELDKALQEKGSRLFIFSGIAEEVVDQLLDSMPIEAVFVNEDYTPFSKQRDSQIESVCHKHNVAFNSHSDALLHDPLQVLKPNGQPYTVFTPMFKRASLLPVEMPKKNNHSNYYRKEIIIENKQILNALLREKNSNLLVKGGRKEGLQLLKRIANLKDYKTIRNYPALSGTTHLSAHHKFGTISIRETYHTVKDYFGSQHTLINELHWRDFFTHIAFHFPRIFREAFQRNYISIAWRKNEKMFQAWREGKTGFPIVDAGMREMNASGYMHNRVRMITASFLCKDLHIDWREGEKYFAQKLTDYDPAVNNGNWQWAASTGCDAQPYFRIFNPWLQQKKFDPDCVYIKRWVPELELLSAKEIHSLNIIKPLLADYVSPIVNHRLASQQAKEMYKSIQPLANLPVDK